MNAPEYSESLPCTGVEISDAILAQLIPLLLRSANCIQGHSEVEVQVLSQLQDLAQHDPAFNSWLTSVVGNIVAKDANSNQTCERSAAKPSICSIDLLTGLSWRTLLQAVINIGQTSTMATIAKQVASLAFRLRELQTRYRTDLEHLRQESLYQLAYGLSHELNNPLANIAARGGLLLNKCDDPDDRLLLETIIDNASRGSEMIGDLMLIARPPAPRLSRVDLAEVGSQVAEKAKHWSRLRGLQCELSWPPPSAITTDASMLNEIIWALLRNAIEASPIGGTIQIDATLESQFFRIHIQDQGAGLSKQALEHCFDPYYSGREAGRGLGMGLTKAKRLARLLGGDVALTNRPIGGCQASISIPTSIVV